MECRNIGFGGIRSIQNAWHFLQNNIRTNSAFPPHHSIFPLFQYSIGYWAIDIAPMAWTKPLAMDQDFFRIYAPFYGQIRKKITLDATGGRNDLKI
jgi:hypothetical protein